MTMTRDMEQCCGGFVLPNRVNPLRQHPLNQTIRLLMVGVDNAGKTVTSKQLVGDSVTSIVPTVGFSRVNTRYKGFEVEIYDVGGSRSFRAIWKRYYGEVHGFIFVVDSSASDERMEENREVLKEFLDHERVRGKPLLMLCNKADVEEARDEIEIVHSLTVERLVNEAKCPTRIDACVAANNRGIREGFKWLIKSILSQMPEIFVRVNADVETDRKEEEKKRQEFRKRMEEERQQQESVDDSAVGEQLPGFVPIEEAVKSKNLENSNSDLNGKKLDLEPVKDTKRKASLLKSLSIKD